MNQGSSSIPEERYPERSLRDFLYILFRHKWKVILFFLAVMITVTLGTFLVAEIYRAEAKLMVRIGRENVSLDPTATTGQVISIGQSRESEINSELEILKSRELALRIVDAIGPQVFLKPPDEESAAQVSSTGTNRDRIRDLQERLGEAMGKLSNLLEDLGLATSLSDREKAVINFRKNLEIEVQKNNNILSLTYDGRSPKLAEKILAKLIDFYLDKHITAHRTIGSYGFFDKQKDQLRTQVVRAEEDLKNLKTNTGVASLEEQRKIILYRIGTLQQDTEATQAALAISRAKVQDLKEKLADVPPTLVTQETTGTQNYGSDLMRAKLYELQLKEQDLLSKFAETSQPVLEIRRQIAEAQALVDKEEPTRTQVTTGINTTHQQLNLALLMEMTTLSSLEAKAKVLKPQLDGARREVNEINHTEVMMANLQRELSLQEAKYRKYSENLEQARIDQALETNKISNISVVQAANASMKPVKPRKALNLALGFFLGIFGGLGLAFFSEYLDHSIKTPQDVGEKVKLQLLASIPYLKRK
jgi:uncharacterized protein involved in exopolysaccharide biosynthesis